MSEEHITTQRLDLIPMSLPLMEACIAGDSATAERLLGLQIPSDWFDEAWVIQLRLDQARNDPAFLPWVPRAIGLREDRVMIGSINFHTAPDPEYLQDIAPGGVEFGYGIFEPYRRRGYAQEAVLALMEWTARERKVSRFVLSISPENAPSLRIAHNLGFVKIGQHIDEEDGPEDIFERQY